MGSQFAGRGNPGASLRSHGLPGRQDKMFIAALRSAWVMYPQATPRKAA